MEGQENMTSKGKSHEIRNRFKDKKISHPEGGVTRGEIDGSLESRGEMT